MKSWIKSIFFSALAFLAVLGFITANSDQTNLFSTQTFTQQNLGVLTNVNAQQLTTLLQQIGAQNPSGSGGSVSPSAVIPPVLHRVSGVFQPGGQVVLQVIGSPSMAGAPFAIAFSNTGDYPGVDFSLGHIPLNPPYLLVLSGQLGPTGQAQVFIPLPLSTGICNIPLTTAAVILNPATTQLVFSNPVTYDVCKGVQGVSCCTTGVKSVTGSACIDQGVSINYCRGIGGAVQECIPTETRQDPPPGAPVNLTLANLSNAAVDTIMKSVINSSISNKTYVPSTFDCDDFADALQKSLNLSGFSSTYTYFIKYRGTTNVVDYSHAVTDVHLPDGSVIWIEPQTGEIIDLDFDGDGHVGANDAPNPYQHGYYPTDDNAKISVYDNVEQATAAGAPRD